MTYGPAELGGELPEESGTIELIITPLLRSKNTLGRVFHVWPGVLNLEI